MALSAASVITSHADADVTELGNSVAHTDISLLWSKAWEEAGNIPASPNLPDIKSAGFCGIQDFRCT